MNLRVPHSKTFVFPTCNEWANFLIELDEKISCVRAPIENTIRITIKGEKIYDVDELAKKHHGTPEISEAGKWLPTSR